MDIDVAELKRGLSSSQQYLLSHHESHEWYRCYAIPVFGRTVRICARCLGVYLGIAAGILTYGLLPAWVPTLVVVAVLPLPALVDWYLTTFFDRRGYNGVRTLTGGLLGYAYGLGLLVLVVGFDWRVVVVGLAYGIAAAILLGHKPHPEPS